MKRITYLTAILFTAIVIVSSCDSKREPGKIYMPDMAYSRAVETYTLLDSTVFTHDTAKIGKAIFYNFTPVAGTINRGEQFPYTVPNDSNGLINLSALVKNPLGPLTSVDSLEASRLYNINCGICHGAKAGADGPVGLKIGGVKSIISAMESGFSDGRIFHVMTYGQGNMGSYASQLSRKQRWQIVQYLRTLAPKTAAAAPATTAPAAADSATAKKI